MADESNLEIFCRELIDLDKSIRSAGVADNVGRLVTVVYRRGLVPLLSRTEIERYTTAAVIRAYSRDLFESKIGKQRYVVGVYEKMHRVTIPIRFNIDRRFFLLMSLDVGADSVSIIEEKVLAHIAKNKEYFL